MNKNKVPNEPGTRNVTEAIEELSVQIKKLLSTLYTEQPGSCFMVK